MTVLTDFVVEIATIVVGMGRLFHVEVEFAGNIPRFELQYREDMLSEQVFDLLLGVSTE